MYTVDYFIKKFSGIPGKNWIVGELGNDDGPKCAMGHCGERESSSTTVESEALRGLVLNYLPINQRGEYRQYGIEQINDGDCEHYKQKTAKGRVLAALKDIKKAIDFIPPYKDVTKKLAVLPVDEVPDVKIIKELEVV